MELIETGRIINIHGIRGEVKLEPWADSPEEVCAFWRLFVDGREYAVERARVQKRFVLAKLRGVDDPDSANALRDKVVCVPREDLGLGEDRYLLSDLVGCEAFDEDGNALGRVTDVISLPGGEVLEIRGEREILVPRNPEFVKDADVAARRLVLRLIEGM